jgi:hypothetical protein
VAPVEFNAPPVQFQLSPSPQSAELLGMTDPVESDPAAAQSNDLSRANASVQATGGPARGEGVHQVAQEGVSGGGGALPHLPQIQSAFGQHDVTGIKSHVGGAAS